MSSIKRAQSSRQPRDRFLIVCEGSKTEPSYFKGLTNYLQMPASVEVITSPGSAPISVVDEAIKRLSKKGSQYDQVWVVFDREQWNYNPTFGVAVDKASANGIAVATSNPSIEFWFLLHNEFTTRQFLNCDDVMKHLKQFLPDYAKGGYDFRNLFENTQTACCRAEKVLQYHRAASQDDSDESNPSTKVHRLAEALLQSLSKSRPSDADQTD
ncbi:MAG: RloB family protein [Armatimonadetes bacterium]|nr:RloB family protein [Armatimonadota bacterium]